MIIKLDNPIERCEMKFAANSKGEFSGYASVFNGVDAVLDIILPGAFTETLKGERPPPMFVNHDSYQVPVGDWIELSEDDHGLSVKGKIDLNHKEGPTVFSALKRKAMDALSIGFRIPKGGAEEKENGTREINKIDLKEISIVNFPADDAARISIVKTDVELIETLKEMERFLRDSGGYSRSTAVALVSRIKHLRQSDSDLVEDEITKRHIEQNTARLIHIFK